MDQFLAGLKRLIIQGIDWLFWLISLAWNWTFGQISRALSSTFHTLPDWKAILYILLVLLLVFLAYSILPRLIGAIMAVFRAIWAVVETLVAIAIDLMWYIIGAYLIALAINTLKIGPVIGKMPWQ
ncbi:MAG: hypothetical protein JSS20_02380 [Proteobacteria bacterium]|nr:hypothetical protein [Pseudomonadota bacterium]